MQDLIKIISKNSKTKEREHFDREYEKLIDKFIVSAGLGDNCPPNLLIPPHLQHDKLRNEIKSQVESEELSRYLKIAIDSLIKDGSHCTELTEYEDMQVQFFEAIGYLNELDVTKPMEENLQKILHISDSVMATAIKIAQYEYEENRLEESLSIFAFLSLLNPEDPDYWYRLGIVTYQLQHFELALRAFTNATSLDISFIETRIYSAECYTRLNRLNEAKEELDKIHDLFDKSSIDPVLSEMIANIEEDINKAA
ncbi:MAG: hypothetical protein H0T62_08490 [Parachlamydiaceae bacterium]|nr:hypothetical protein [Parachlamydiaceae bacterium]